MAASEHVIVTEWLDGTPLSQVIEEGTQEARDQVALQLVRFSFSSPTRCGYLHADPHPGNFRVTADGRLGVLDFGAVTAGYGLLSQLAGTAAYRAEAERWIPGFAGGASSMAE